MLMTKQTLYLLTLTILFSMNCLAQTTQAVSFSSSIDRLFNKVTSDILTTAEAMPEEKFDFLGYTFGRCYSPKTGRVWTVAMRNGMGFIGKGSCGSRASGDSRDPPGSRQGDRLDPGLR